MGTLVGTCQVVFGRIVVSEIEVLNIFANSSRYGMKWMSGGTKRQYNRALLPGPRDSGPLWRMHRLSRFANRGSCMQDARCSWSFRHHSARKDWLFSMRAPYHQRCRYLRTHRIRAGPCTLPFRKAGSAVWLTSASSSSQKSAPCVRMRCCPRRKSPFRDGECPALPLLQTCCTTPIYC
jgi:hypothetical protein